MAEVKLRNRKELEGDLEQINQSFEFKDAHLELSSDTRAKAVVEFIGEHFFPDETLIRSMQLTFDDTVRNFLLDLLSENLSVLLISNSTDEIIACRTMFISKKNDITDWSMPSNKKLGIVFTFLGHKYNEIDVFKRFGVDTAVELLALATHRNYRDRGIASKLMEATLLYCKELGFSPVCVQGEGTSQYSQRIFEKLGFETIHILKLDEYKFDSEIVTESAAQLFHPFI